MSMVISTAASRLTAVRVEKILAKLTSVST
jgi:hypothetical protein